ncbi:hypothetical protein JCM11641_007620 [Rhodosporidiobolus odoratus]
MRSPNGPSSSHPSNPSSPNWRLLPDFLSSSPKSKHRRLSSSIVSTISTLPPAPQHGQLVYGHPTIPPGALLLSSPSVNVVSPAGRTNQTTYIDNRPPRKIGIFEAWWIWYTGGFVSSMLETWEFLLIHTVFLFLLLLFYFALSHVPAHAAQVANRVRYYVSGPGEWGRS